MMILDASVAVKMFVPEAGSDSAARFYREQSGALVAPDLFAIEVAAALVRNVNAAKAASAGMERALSVFFGMLKFGEIVLLATGHDVLEKATRIAIDLGHPLKDCIYLAHAIERDCPLMTADAKFVAKAVRVWENVRLLPTD